MESFETPGAKSRKWQFGLSTLLILVAATAFGCFGWQLGDWVSRVLRPGRGGGPMIHVTMKSVMWLPVLLIPPMLLLGRFKTAACCFLGLSVNVLIMLWRLDEIPNLLEISRSRAIHLSLNCLPLAAFLGSLNVMYDGKGCIAARYSLFLLSCLSAGWFIGLLHGQP